VIEIAENIYDKLGQLGVEVLYDDRDESAGVKFNDADLLGMPIRVTVSKRSLEAGGVEVKLRAGEESMIVPLDGFEDKISGLMRHEFSRFVPEG
jgi:prolyl-tRNA synthetase